MDGTLKPEGKTLETLGKLLPRGWPISSRFDPSIEHFTVLDHSAWKPFVVFRTIANPLDKIPMPASTGLRIKNSFNFMFMHSIWC